MTEAWFLVALVLNMAGGQQALTMDDVGKGPAVIEYSSKEACERAARWQALSERGKPQATAPVRMAMMCVPGWVSQ